MLLKEVLNGLKYNSNKPFENIDIRGISINSKNASKGDLFVACKGEKSDGHDFIKEAVKNGASCVVAEQDEKGAPILITVENTRKALAGISNNFYNNPSGRMTVIGITGTNGKTTTSYLLDSIFQTAGFKTALIGTIQYKSADETYPAPLTTPDAVTINSILDQALKSGSTHALLEISSHALDQERALPLKLDQAIFTNLTPEHLDYHKDINSYFKVKLKIFEMLKPKGMAIINRDDKWAKKAIGILGKGVITYGLYKKSDVYAEIAHMDINGTRLEVVTSAERLGISTRLIGVHNVYNILAAVTAASHLGISRTGIIKGVEGLDFVPGRMEALSAGQGFKVFIDFAHTPDALRNVLNILNKVKEKRIITVFGCGGNRDKLKRPLMGEAAAKLSDMVLITSDNPRNEDPMAIIKDIQKGIEKKTNNCTIEPDRKKAIEKAIHAAETGDIVLIAGKGHESCQIIGEKKIPFDDMRVAEEAVCSLLVK